MLLEVKDLNISYGDKLTVSGVNLELNTGEIMSIVGESRRNNVDCRRIRQRQNYSYPCHYGLPAGTRACYGRQHNF